MAKIPKTYWIDKPEQLEAIVSPARQEILDALQATGPSTALELGGILGRAPDSLYYHLKALLKVGLILEKGLRDPDRGRDMVYALPGKSMQVRYRLERPDVLDGIRRIMAGVLRLARRDFDRALDEGLVIPTGRRRNLNGGRSKGWLDDSQVARVQEHLAAIDRILAEGKQDQKAGLYVFTRIFNPLKSTARP